MANYGSARVYVRLTGYAGLATILSDIRTYKNSISVASFRQTFLESEDAGRPYYFAFHLIMPVATQAEALQKKAAIQAIVAAWPDTTLDYEDYDYWEE